MSFIITGKAKTAAVYQELLANMSPGDLVTQYEERPLAAQLIHQGYNFVSMDFRGAGASFGAKYADLWQNGHDIAQVVEWIAAQPWATAKVGMAGISFEGIVQFFAAAFAPSALACIAPQYPGLTQCVMDGGLPISSFSRDWEALHKGISELEPAAPVDGPDGDQLRAEARSERSTDSYALVEAFSSMDPQIVTEMTVFDALEQTANRSDLGLGSVYPDLKSAYRLINESGIPVYLTTGWWDLTFPGYLIDVFNRLAVQKKLLVGPWSHGTGNDEVELMRWFDYWLKDIDTGIMDEPPVHFASSEPSGTAIWKSASRLPLPEARPRAFYLSSKESETIVSVTLAFP